MSQPFDAETAGNAEEIEMQWSVKVVEHLEVRVEGQSRTAPADAVCGLVLPY